MRNSKVDFRTIALMILIAVVLSSIAFGTNRWMNPSLNTTVTAVDSATLVTSDGTKHNAFITYTNESLQCAPGMINDETTQLYYQWYVNNKTVVSQKSSSEGEGGTAYDYPEQEDDATC